MVCVCGVWGVCVVCGVCVWCVCVCGVFVVCVCFPLVIGIAHDAHAQNYVVTCSPPNSTVILHIISVMWIESGTFPSYLNPEALVQIELHSVRS